MIRIDPYRSVRCLKFVSCITSVSSVSFNFPVERLRNEQISLYSSLQKSSANNRGNFSERQCPPPAGLYPEWVVIANSSMDNWHNWLLPRESPYEIATFQWKIFGKFSFTAGKTSRERTVEARRSDFLPSNASLPRFCLDSARLGSGSARWPSCSSPPARWPSALPPSPLARLPLLPSSPPPLLPPHAIPLSIGKSIHRISIM